MKPYLQIIILTISLLYNCAENGISLTGKSKTNNMPAMLAFAGVTMPMQKSVTINFRAIAGAQDFVCGQTLKGHTGTSSDSLINGKHISESTTVQPVDLRFYITGVSLIALNGSRVPVTITHDGVWQYNQSAGSVALLSFTDNSSTTNSSSKCAGATNGLNTQLKGTISAPVLGGNVYSGITFTLGLPQSLNYITTSPSSAPAPMNANLMNWSTSGGGNKFLKMNYNTLDGSGTTDFLYLGSTGCSGQSTSSLASGTCDNNKPSISVTPSAGFNIATQSVAIDIQQLVSGLDVSDGTSFQCQSTTQSASCSTLFSNLGIDITTGKASTTATQKTFTIK